MHAWQILNPHRQRQQNRNDFPQQWQTYAAFLPHLLRYLESVPEFDDRIKIPSFGAACCLETLLILKNI